MKTSAICIVDDEPTIREGIALAFESSYQMEAFADAETAIKSLKHDPPILVLGETGTVEVAAFP